MHRYNFRDFDWLVSTLDDSCHEIKSQNQIKIVKSLYMMNKNNEKLSIKTKIGFVILMKHLRSRTWQLKQKNWLQLTGGHLFKRKLLSNRIFDMVRCEQRSFYGSICIRKKFNEKSKHNFTMTHNILHDKNHSKDF